MKCPITVVLNGQTRPGIQSRVAQKSVKGVSIATQSVWPVD